jgi:hypothetical protein
VGLKICFVLATVIAGGLIIDMKMQIELNQENTEKDCVVNNSKDFFSITWVGARAGD